MTDRLSRREALAGSAAGLAGLVGLAGCSTADLPVVGDDGGAAGLPFDPAPLADVVPADRLQRPATYPGPVPAALATTHRERARALLDQVPAEPSIPNGAVAERIAADRADALERLREAPRGATPLERLADWRHRRGRTAAVAGAYGAATADAGAVDARTLAARRERLRRRLDAAWSPWAYEAPDPVEAVAVHAHLESLVDTASDLVDPGEPFPARPTAAVFDVGDQVAALERAAAALDDLAGLWRVYRDAREGLSPTRDRLGIASHRLRLLVQVSQGRDTPPLDGETPTVDRDLSAQPAEHLLADARRVARHQRAQADAARERRHLASAVVASGRALVALLAWSTVVEAVRDGAFGTPTSAAEVRQHRSQALEAVRATRTQTPEPLALAVAAPAWTALAAAERSLGGASERDRSRGRTIPDRHDVSRAVASYGLARHLAASVSPVTGRLGTALTAG